MNDGLSRYLSDFEMKMQLILEGKARSMNVLDEGSMPSSEDIDRWWKDNAPYCMEDAVREFNGYPTVVLAWAGFIGMAIAEYWDRDWEKHCKVQYRDLYGKDGYDDMDENILGNILGYPVTSDPGIRLSGVMRSLAREAMDFIRHSNIEHGTGKAFYVLVRTMGCMYRTGAAIRLRTLGYKWKKA